MAKYNKDLITCYPDYWLAFLVLGKPDLFGEGTRNSFNSGVLVSSDIKVVDLIPKEFTNSGKSGLSNGQSSKDLVLGNKSSRASLHDYRRQSSKEEASKTVASDMSVSDKSTTHHLRISKASPKKKTQLEQLKDVAMIFSLT